jgi:signal transduction histidine kinase/CheY-like chemotaxis protein
MPYASDHSPDTLPDTQRGWYWIPVVLLTLGIGSIVMLLASNWVRDRLLKEDVYLVRAVEQIQTSTAVAHLWVEELVTGDDVDSAVIRGHLEEAQKLIDEIVAADSAGGLVLFNRSAFDAGLREHALQARRHIVAFAEISERRVSGYAGGDPVGIGSQMDVRFDAVFYDLFDELDHLEDLLEARLAHSAARARTLFRFIMVAWSVIVALAAAAIFNRERSRRETERALRASEAQLLQAQKMEAVGRLAGGIAHDINNHLAAITAQCELVKMGGAADDRIAGKMDAVIQTAGKSAALIRRLLAFSRREPIVPQTVNINEIFDGIGSMLDRLIGEDIRLSMQRENELWNVSIDPSQLEQVLLNLVVNSRDAMPRGGRLTVSTRNCEISGGRSRLDERIETGDYICVSVTDSGTGIPEDIRDKIFEPFFSTKERSQGTGLGLATIHGIVKQNHGHIEVDSTVGQGTTFRIYLPRSTGKVTAMRHTENAAASRAEGPTHILLVEDNEELRISTCEILETLGYTVSTASCAEDALEFFESEGGGIDLVITDVIMPGMDGKQMADLLLDSRPDLKIVFMSGYTDDIILDRGVTRGAVDFVPKPFSAAQLTAKLQEVLTRRRVTSAA